MRGASNYNLLSAGTGVIGYSNPQEISDAATGWNNNATANAIFNRANYDFANSGSTITLADAPGQNADPIEAEQAGVIWSGIYDKSGVPRELTVLLSNVDEIAHQVEISSVGGIPIFHALSPDSIDFNDFNINAGSHRLMNFSYDTGTNRWVFSSDTFIGLDNNRNGIGIGTSVTVAFSPFEVVNTNDTGIGSLRQAILNANSTIGQQTITFNIPGAGVHTIQPLTALPATTDAVVIDGYSQSDSTPNTLQVGTNAILRIEIDGSLAGAGVYGLQIGGGNSIVRGLVINRFSRSGIDISPVPGSTANLIEGNYLGTDPTGTVDQGNAVDGVEIRAGSNTIGGTTPGARNVISGNTIHGVEVTLGGSGNFVLGNYIGTDATGTVDLGNTMDGVFLAFRGNNTIGGTLAGARNVISGNNGYGVDVTFSNELGNTILGNYIGTNAAGTAAVANNAGGVVLLAADNVVGGTTAGARNVISGNFSFGVQAQRAGNAILGNYIGTNFNGSAAVPNQVGVQVKSGPGTLIGGPGLAGNLISGNLGHGVELVTSQGSTVVGNRIGTDASGASPLGNKLAGVFIRNDSGTTEDSQANLVGGTTAADGNTIAYNGGPGVVVARPNAAEPSNLNAIRANVIFGNIGLSIDLGDDGITFNDNLDPDGGANDKQNFPVLLSAATATGMTTVTGFLSSAPNTSFFIDFYASDTLNLSGLGEAKTFLGTALVTTDGAGQAPINKVFSAPVAFGQYVSATATTINFFPAGNTSELSPPVQVPIPPVPPAISISDITQAEGNGPGGSAFTFTVTRSGDTSGPSTVQYGTADGTAAALSDYSAIPTTTLNFAAGETSTQIMVNVIGDTAVEGNETFFVNLSGATNATISDAQGVGTITNDDVAPPAPLATAIIGSDPAAPSKMALIVTGTDAGEYIDVDPGSSSSKLKVEVDDLLIGEFLTSAFDRIYVYAKAGADRVSITTAFTRTAVVFGGDGADQIKGGNGKDILLGEADGDIIRGRKGRDFIIGGAGADGISGDEDDDLIIAAATTFDADLPALFAFQKEWVSGNSYSTRRDNVRNGTGSNVGGRKINNTSILEDKALDLLSGNTGRDLFFYHKTGSATEVADKINDKASDETAVDSN